MEDQIVSFETAKLAKEKDFFNDSSTLSICYNILKAYDIEGRVICSTQGNIVEGYFLAPTQSLLQKWLREQGWHIEVIPDNDKKEGLIWWPTIYHIVTMDKETIKLIPEETYEEALEHALQEHLKNL